MSMKALAKQDAQNANTGEGFGSAESAKKPAAYIECGTTCRIDVYFITLINGVMLLL